ncbi:MAG: hypothetical protein LC808_19755, partial [Actinobacteria bacterium]|nr:hypothetical protein [Actinomycetota bacterium]
LELREKFGPIQSHVLELRVETRRFRNLATELQGSLVRFSENPELCPQLSGFDETKRRIDSILSEPGGQSLFTTTIKELQNENRSFMNFATWTKVSKIFKEATRRIKCFHSPTMTRVRSISGTFWRQLKGSPEDRFFCLPIAEPCRPCLAAVGR